MSDHMIADPDARMTREALEARAAKGAGALKALGAKPDDRVAVIMRNDLPSLEIMRATGLAEVVAVPLNWHGDHLSQTCRPHDLKAGKIIAHDHRNPVVRLRAQRLQRACAFGRAGL